MKVLVLTCKTGGGHNACAKYIKEECDANNIVCDVKDFFSLINQKASEKASDIYLFTTNGNGRIFKYFYKAGEIYDSTIFPSPLYGLSKLNRLALNNYVKENNYDLVIATHLFPALTLTTIKKKYGINFILVATDYESTPFFSNTTPDYFIIPSPLLMDRFIEKENKKEILVPLGIPVSTKFINCTKNLKNELNIKDENVVLLLSGSMGFGAMYDTVLSLTKIPNTKIIVVCGSNKNLIDKLEKINNKNIIALGFVDNVNELINTADVVLTKPGGLSTTEVAVMNKPLIHVLPIPGGENYNAKFFEDNGMSINCKNKKDILPNTIKLLADKDLQKRIVENQKKFINKKSAKDLVDFITSHYNN